MERRHSFTRYSRSAFRTPLVVAGFACPGAGAAEADDATGLAVAELTVAGLASSSAFATAFAFAFIAFAYSAFFCPWHCSVLRHTPSDNAPYSPGKPEIAAPKSAQPLQAASCSAPRSASVSATPRLSVLLAMTITRG